MSCNTLHIKVINSGMKSKNAEPQCMVCSQLKAVMCSMNGRTDGYVSVVFVLAYIVNNFRPH